MKPILAILAIVVAFWAVEKPEELGAWFGRAQKGFWGAALHAETTAQRKADRAPAPFDGLPWHKEQGQQ